MRNKYARAACWLGWPACLWSALFSSEVPSSEAGINGYLYDYFIQSSNFIYKCRRIAYLIEYDEIATIPIKCLVLTVFGLHITYLFSNIL